MDSPESRDSTGEDAGTVDNSPTPVDRFRTLLTRLLSVPPGEVREAERDIPKRRRDKSAG